MARGYSRFTPQDDAMIREWFTAYVPVPAIARQLGRSPGVIRQRIRHLNLHRSGPVSQCLKWAPDHLAAQVTELSPQAFRAACFAWRAEQPAVRAAEKVDRWARASAEIDRIRSLSRNAKLRAKRLAGMTHEAIAKQHGLTRERVRQLTTDGWKPSRPRAWKGRVRRRIKRLEARIGDMTRTIERLKGQLAESLRKPRQRRVRPRRKSRNSLMPVIWPQGPAQDIDEEVGLVIREAPWGRPEGWPCVTKS